MATILKAIEREVKRGGQGGFLASPHPPPLRYFNP